MNNEAPSFLRTPEQDHRNLLQLTHFGDPRSTKAKPLPSTLASLVSDVPWNGIQNAQWCRPPEEDAHPSPPIDYNQCEDDGQLIDMDINGGMTSQLNKILKVAIWAARDKSCFFVNEEKGEKHFSHSKLGYRMDGNGEDYYIPNFFDRYFEHMGLEKSEFLARGKGSLTTNDLSRRFRLRSLPQLGYVDVNNIALKNFFLRRLFRIKPHVREHACNKLASQGLDNEYIALSIRRGDKETETEILDTVAPYVREAEAAIKSHFGGEVPTFFVA
ncbi:hypothetical protein ACHAXR_003205, partial [Thalassiosira sp. AJA248-18]